MAFEFPIISADSHIIEPPDLWQKRIEPSLRHVAPRVVSFQDSDLWIVNKHDRMAVVGIQQQAGLRFSKHQTISKYGRYEDLPALDPDTYVKDLAADSVSGAVIYSTNAHQAFGLTSDDLMTAIARTYNDWVLEYCSGHKDTLKPVTLICIDNPAEGVREMERTAKLGTAGFMLPLSLRANKGHNEPEFEPVWDAAESIGLPLSFHTGAQHRLVTKRLHVDLLRHIGSDLHVRAGISRMILHGVFARHPKLRLGIVEFGCGWVPYQLKRLDEAYKQYHKTLPYRFKDGELPSDHFRRNCFVSFQADGAGIALYKEIGLHNLFWGNDYPHAESTYPRSREILGETLASVDAEAAALIAGGNVAKMYGFKLPDTKVTVPVPEKKPAAAPIEISSKDLQGRRSNYTVVREPGDLWTSRLPAALRSQAPHIVGNRWVLGAAESPFHSPDDFDVEAQGTPTDGKGLVDYLEKGFLKAAVLFPDKARRLFARCHGELLEESIKVYNDWALELCKAAPDRLRAVTLVNVETPELGAAEMRRCAKLGAVGFVVPTSFRQKVRYSENDYDLIWQTASELGLPVCLQARSKRTLQARGGRERRNIITDDPTWRICISTADDTSVRLTIDALVLSGVFDRHPTLQLVVAGYGIGWTRHSLQRTDDNYEVRPERLYPELSDYHRDEQHIEFADNELFGKFGLPLERVGYSLPEGVKPTDVILKHAWFVLGDDPLDRLCVKLLDPSRLLWGSGSPGEGPPSDSRELAEALGPSARMVLTDNWAKVWRS